MSIIDVLQTVGLYPATIFVSGWLCIALVVLFIIYNILSCMIKLLRR